MKWRCTWCGKPHAENDPPCDNCGHNVFEKAIVREGVDESAASSSETAGTGTVDTGTTYVWRCQNCGRDHVRNNPPCARCGSHDLEKTEQTYDDVDRELETSSWLELARPYAPIVAVFVLIVALFATGIIPLSIIPGVGAPSPPDAPGEGAEAAGIDLEETELAVHDRLEADRETGRTYDDGLAAYAEYYNRALVAIEYSDADPDPVEPSEFDVDCGGDVATERALVGRSIEEYDDGADLADAVAQTLRSTDSATDAGFDIEGMDLHVVDGSVYLFYAAC